MNVCSPGSGEGRSTVVAGLLGLLPGASIAEAERGELVVAAYRGDATLGAVKQCLGAATLGVVLTQVPLALRRYVEREIVPAIGAPVLGILPETRALRAHTARGLAIALDANLLAAEQGLDNVIEAYMIGAMSHIGASGVPYFERMQQKAVVTGGDRIDVHLAALGTPCQALVLTGGYDPDPVVVERAEAEGCPLLQVTPETPETMDRIGAFMNGLRYRELNARAAVELVRRHVDLAPIQRALGVGAAAV